MIYVSGAACAVIVMFASLVELMRCDRRGKLHSVDQYLNFKLTGFLNFHCCSMSPFRLCDWHLTQTSTWKTKTSTLIYCLSRPYLFEDLLLGISPSEQSPLVWLWRIADTCTYPRMMLSSRFCRQNFSQPSRQHLIIKGLSVLIVCNRIQRARNLNAMPQKLLEQSSVVFDVKTLKI